MNNKFINMGRIVIWLTITLLLSSCAGSRNVEGDFELINSGRISQDDIPQFIDCVSDSFRDRTLGLGVQMISRHRKLSDKYLIELVISDRGLALSADINNDGRVGLYDRVGLFHVNWRLQGEIQGFSNCLAKFEVY